MQLPLNFIRDVSLCHALQRGIEPQMLTHGQATEQHIVLWADSEAFSDQIDISSDVMPVNDGGTRRWREQPS